MEKKKIQGVVEEFRVEGEFFDVVPFGSGHINDTLLVTLGGHQYILQRINHSIFPEVEKMNDNIIRALGALHSKQKGSGNHRFRHLEILCSREGKNHWKDKAGNFWRLMNFVEKSRSFDVAEQPGIAYEAARGYGYFQKCLIELDPDDFFPVIPDFHNLAKRIEAFQKVEAEDPAGRLKGAKQELKFANDRLHLSTQLTGLLQSGNIPQRVTHNDTKINNVLLDDRTLEAVAVVDLDTVMPGTVLFDFGDMVRTFTSPAAEDEQNLSKVVLRTEIFEAMAKGYLSELKEVLKKDELAHLVFGGKVMTYMIGIRFLTDFLEGDVYYKTSRPFHNLDRCRTQFKLLEEIEEKEDMLQEILRKV